MYCQLHGICSADRVRTGEARECEEVCYRRRQDRLLKYCVQVRCQGVVDEGVQVFAHEFAVLEYHK